MRSRTGTLVAGTIAIVAMAVLGGGPRLTPAARAAGSDPCAGMQSVTIDGVIECTHGADLVPPPLPDPPMTTRALASPSCPGNGVKGARVHVLLGVPSDTTAPAPASIKALVRQAVALADANLDATSPQVGQHYRFYCRTDTNVTIATVSLPPIGSDNTYTFGDVTKGLSNAGYTKGSAIYATFVPNIDCCYTYGGQGSLATDDRPGAAINDNNGSFARYSMVRLGAEFDASTLALLFQHETGHNMGAVQNSAPHTSGAYHCYETNDVMCYNDGGSYFTGGGTLVSVCPALTTVGLYVFDCGGDDYYNASPPANSYLADHWDVSESKWLTPVGASGT
jgi:hypothetical protein